MASIDFVLLKLYISELRKFFFPLLVPLTSTFLVQHLKKKLRETEGKGEEEEGEKSYGFRI